MAARRYLIILSVADNTPAALGKMLDPLKRALQKLSAEPMEQAFRSHAADIFGYFVRSELDAHQIRVRLKSPGKNPVHSMTAGDVPFLSGSDGLLIVEIGEDFTWIDGFSRVGTWLQHH